ncbi:MAG: hydroxymethylglutaryl-CoA reductase (NADPH) [Methanosarcinales archaeon]|nr:hydroxymethylglutaryl-CoA reductase (NADPH) [Methanosarcinales archaeon]
MKHDKGLSKDEIIQKVIKGEMKLHAIDQFMDVVEAVDIRREAAERITDTKLDNVGRFSIDETEAAKRNIENMIGAIQIPLGMAGPVTINGEYACGNYYLPLATTEGALVASTNRGCSVISECGGTNVRIFNDGMTRAPVFTVKDVVRAREFVDWVNDPGNFEAMKAKASGTTRFGELLDVMPFVAGNNVYLRFSFDTKDAMGMNMATIASEAICDFITGQLDVELVSLSGNVCTDKKPSAINNILGRGKTVIADVVIPGNVVEQKLKTEPGSMVKVNYKKNLLGSARAGSTGFNAHVANIVAAMYLACGQDAAHVVEASSAITSMELTDKGDLYCSVTLPAIQVGTVGGGTGIATQRECLEMLGVAGAGEPPGTNAKKLAEIIGAAALAGEISLIGAQAAGHLARAHKQMGR